MAFEHHLLDAGKFELALGLLREAHGLMEAAQAGPASKEELRALASLLEDLRAGRHQRARKQSTSHSYNRQRSKRLQL